MDKASSRYRSDYPRPQSTTETEAETRPHREHDKIIIFVIIIFVIINIITKSTVDRDNNHCHFVILRIRRLRNYATLASGWIGGYLRY
jgi:hypothetical protein